MLAVPVAFAIRLIPAWHNETLLFIVVVIGIVPLAARMSCATEHLSERAGHGVGGLLNATFGNATELIISLIALSKGLIGIVKAAMIGSILGNILFMLGAAILAGGLRFHHLRFNETGTRVASTSLGLATIGLVIPTVFQWATERQPESWVSGATQHLSLVIAITLLATYALWLVFSLVTHTELFMRSQANEHELVTDAKCNAPWSTTKSLYILAVSTFLVAILGDFLADSVQTACENLGLTQVFVGVIVVAMVGNASESTAVVVAMKNKMDLSLNIAIGASLQIALFVIPVLVLSSSWLGHPMTLQFSLPEVIALALAVGIVILISGDGECNWVEGAQLIFVYVIIATLFYFLPASDEASAGQTTRESTPVFASPGLP